MWLQKLLTYQGEHWMFRICSEQPLANNENTGVLVLSKDVVFIPSQVIFIS